MRLDVDYDELLPHPIDAVWRELTEAAVISDWLMATSEFRPVVGCRFRLKSPRLGNAGWIEAEVLEVTAPHRMVWSWSGRAGYPPSMVTFELNEDGAGTRLRMRHVGEFDGELAESLRSGWPGRIAALAEAIKGGGDGQGSGDEVSR